MEPTQRFSRRVENYVRYRPGYPPGVLRLLGREYGLTKDAVIADIGSGTGLLSRLFLENGNRVFGVEPNAEMRLAGERLSSGYAGFSSVPARAEETTLPDAGVGFVTAGQAFHWFDPGPTRREFSRILRPGGRVVLIWNARRKEVTGFLAAYERALKTYGTDYSEVEHGQRGSPEEVRAFFDPEPVETATFDNAQAFDLAGLKGRALSSSYVPAEGEPGNREMLKELEIIFQAYQQNGTVTVEYDTRVYIGRL